MSRELRFDVVESYYLWLSLHHGGIVGRPYSKEGGFEPVQRNPLWWCSYNRLSFIPTRLQFKPSPSLSFDTLSERGQDIYTNLCVRLGVCNCLENNDDTKD